VFNITAATKNYFAYKNVSWDKINCSFEIRYISKLHHTEIKILVLLKMNIYSLIRKRKLFEEVILLK